MKNRQWLRTLLCLALTLCTVLTLCACPSGTPGEGGGETHTHSGGTATCKDRAVCEGCGEAYGALAAHTYENGTCTVCGAKEGGEVKPPESGKPEADNFGNGGTVSGAGATIPEDSSALTPTTYDESTAEEITAVAFFRSAVKAEGKVFRVTDGKPVTISGGAGMVYDGQGSILIAPNGVTITGCRDIALINVVIIGSVTVADVEGLEFENVEIVSTATALSTDATVSGVKMSDCRLTGKTAFANGADNAVVVNSYMAFTEKGIVDAATTGTTIQHCILEGNGTAITSGSSEAAFKNLTITMGTADKGIVLSGNYLNSIVALNVITGAQTSISLSGAKNTAVILNSVVSIQADNNRNIYICDNQLGGRLSASNNDYFLADGNVTPDDEWNHETIQSGNTNTNGNSLMDVDARPEYGADEALLPHIDKDLFVGMERKTAVKDILYDGKTAIASYILEKCKTDDYVIIAPGAYATESGMAFRLEHSDTTVYAYGVYMERQNGLSQMMNYSNAAKNIVIKGMTIGFKQQTCGQVYVLEKLSNNTLRVVTGAGMMNEFGNTDPKFYDTTGMGAQRMGTFYAYCDTGFNRITKDNSASVPTMMMEVSKSVYNMLAEGDILTCRATNGGTTISIGGACEGIVFYDFTIYGNASGFAYVENDANTATTYYRVCDTTQNGFVIDEATYNAYLALEEQYGVSLEIGVDDLGRFRGSPAHIGSIDATHTTRCGEGSQATFCLFENMCDDATNQNATHGRLAEVKDNGDGTTTIIYKGNYSQYSYEYNQAPGNPGGFCANFDVGDRVYVYTSTGQLVCDTEALKATAILHTETFDWKDFGWKHSLKGTVSYRSVTVKTDAVNFDALNGFDLADHHWQSKNKVLIDNMSQSSNGFKFDNCKFQNIRSRGLLIKASEGAIVNCTFRNIGMACAAILYEIYWGESGVTENMIVDRNLIDHTGYFKNQDLYSPVAVVGLGQSVEEDFLLYKNITITNNRIINRTTNYAVYINSAKDVVIENNYFGEFVGNDFTANPEGPESMDNPKPVIHINGAMNVKIAGNRYPETGYIQDQVVAERNKNIYGADVEFNGTPLIPDSDE